MLTYCEEQRDDNGELLFFRGQCFDEVKLDKEINCIRLSSKNNSDGMLLINPDMRYEVTPLKHARDKITIFKGNNCIKIFGKNKLA